MKTTVLRWLTLVGAVLTLIVTVLMCVKINQQNVSYEEVEAKIVSAEKRRVKKRYHYDVVVEYKGEKYELINVRSEEFSGYEVYKGNYATMYFANGKMYSNIAGIKTEGIAFYIYLGALMSTVVFLRLHVVFVKKSDERIQDG